MGLAGSWVWGAEPQGKRGQTGPPVPIKLYSHTGSGRPGSAQIFPGDLGAHLGSSGTRSSVPPALGRGNKESLGRGPPGSSGLHRGRPCRATTLVVIHHGYAPGSRNLAWGQPRAALRMKRTTEWVQRMKIYLPRFLRPVWAEKALGCGASDSWLGDSSVEFPKYCVAGFDLEMQHLKYLHLTKRPPVTLE